MRRDRETGERIRQARLARGLTQLRLAEHLDVTDGIIAQWENGKRSPTLENLMALSRVLMIHPGELLSDEPPPGRFTMLVDAPDELSLLRQYRRLKPLARKNVCELLGVAADIGNEIELQSEPA